MSEYLADVKKYSPGADEAAVTGVENYLGKGLLSQRDASMVACSDAVELKRIRETFCKKKLGLSHSDDEIDTVLQSVCAQMKDDNSKEMHEDRWSFAIRSQTIQMCT